MRVERNFAYGLVVLLSIDLGKNFEEIMQSRIDMFHKVDKDYGELLLLLDHLADVSFVRIESHYRNAMSEFKDRKASGEIDQNEGVSYLLSAYFLAMRAWDTSDSICCLLRYGKADSAYELWRTLFNLVLNISSMDNSSDTENAGERYLSQALADCEKYEKNLAKAWIDSMTDMEDLEKSTELLRQEFEGIEKLDGWIIAPSDRTLETRALAAGLPAQYYLDYFLAGKSSHGSAISTLKRPSILSLSEKFEMPPVEASPRGVDYVAFITAFLLDSMVDRFVYGTREGEVEEEEDWRQDSQNSVARIFELAQDRVSC